MDGYKKLLKYALVLGIVPLLFSCTSTQRIEGPSSVLTETFNAEKKDSDDPSLTGDRQLSSEQPESMEAVIYHGTGKFVAAPVKGKSTVQHDEQGDMTLNFHNTDIHEVIKVVLGDILAVNYVVDPKAAGTVSLQTSRPLNREAILPMFESILQLNGLALVESSNGYRVLPYSQATHASTPTVGRRGGPGFSIQVIPLSYISANEMRKILEPVVAKEAFVRVDKKRNLLMLAGTGQELENWLNTIRLFDVDWLSGQSVGLFPLNNTNASDIVNELELILDAAPDGVSADLVNIQAMERLNSLLVITSQHHYLNKIRLWIERLDMAGEYPGKGLYVYKVKNRKAADLADIITNVFPSGSRGGGVKKTPAPRLAPGLEPVTLKSREAVKTAVGAASANRQQIPLFTENLDVRVVADEQKNAILIMASAEEYRIIESALRRLDTLPLQVIIEVSIVDVILTDELRYGVEWFFKNTVDGKSGSGRLNFGEAVQEVATGFSYSLVDSSGLVRAVLNALAEDSKINVISSPSLMVLDNNTAEIQVGNQQPIQTDTLYRDTDALANEVISSIEYKDTGVKLIVTPSVNPGGLVTMEVSQEVTDVGEIDSATQQRTFLKRQVTSTVAVKSGQTIVLGGLITENDTVTEQGIPVLYKIPVVGKLFGNTVDSKTRNELLIMLTPRVVENPKDAAGVLDEYRKSMKNLRKHWVSGEVPVQEIN